MKNQTDLAKLTLRVATACFILVYGFEKIAHPGQVEYIGTLLMDIGLPSFLAYGVYIGEVLAPAVMLVGWRTKIAALVVALNMVVVILLGHTNEIFPLSEFIWGAIELQTLFLINAVTVVMLGAGKFALSNKHSLD